MAITLTSAQIAECYKAFLLFSKQSRKSGESGSNIAVWDLQVLLNSYGIVPSQARMAAAYMKYDPDGRGEIDFPQYLKIVQSLMASTDTFQEVRTAFDFWANRAGPPRTITKAHMELVVTKLAVKFTPTEIDEMIGPWDTDNDGMININEFTKIVMDFLHRPRRRLDVNQSANVVANVTNVTMQHCFHVSHVAAKIMGPPPYNGGTTSIAANAALPGPVVFGVVAFMLKRFLSWW